MRYGSRPGSSGREPDCLFESSRCRAYGYLSLHRGILGQRQADKYVGGLLAACDQVAAGEVMKRVIPPEYGVPGFVTRHENHFIYWRELKDRRIGIAAILHVSMLQADHLRKAFGG